jgi:L-lactate dehydrogenase complex protein LldF
MDFQTQTTETFDENAREALRDPVLHGALRNLADNFVERRRVAISSVDDWEGLRTRARAIKDETLAHLDKYLLQLVENAEKGGVKFHWARDGAEACRIVLDLVKTSGAEMVIKSKSMATEEIHLNDALEAAGVEPIETDLGEWIIQLAHETPSHIVGQQSTKQKRR